MLYNINLLGFLLITVSFLFGIKLPDWDFKLRLKHRNILTHSPFLTFIFISLYELKTAYFFKYFIVGFSSAIAVHIIFDLFPKKWSGGALLKIPIFTISCSKKTTIYFFWITVILSEFLAVFYITDTNEFIFLSILVIYTFIKKIRYEKVFFRPTLIFFTLYIALGMLKFNIMYSYLIYLLN